MEKKNPYVMTIGFNRRDPNHRKVAEFLNGMERGKAQYIVNAVLMYQETANRTIVRDENYAEIRRIVMELLKENERNIRTDNADRRTEMIEKMNHKGEFSYFKEKDVENILDSLDMFMK